MTGIPSPGTRTAAILGVGALCAVTTVAAAETAGEPALPGQPIGEILLQSLMPCAFVLVGFVILAVTARWMSVAGAILTLAGMIGLSVWTALEMWNADNALEGLMILLLWLVLPAVACAGSLLDIGGRALARRLPRAR